MSNTPITVAYGDGIGPEIMKATLKVLEKAGARIDIEEIKIGEEVYKAGVPSGIDDSAWESLERTKVLLKAPITTPQGGGVKSLNVTLRKSLGMFANVRPCVSYHPFVKTLHERMDMVIVRENEEDLYAGIEHQQTENTVQCLKLISSTGSEKIIRYAFEYARLYNRKKVTCISKDNIMKMSDGLFHKVFDRVAKEYPAIENDHAIVDIGAARIASRPETYDVIVTENLYGDIISDIAAEVSGSVGLGGSSNIGNDGAMFEAIHGSAPDIAGMGIANPSGLIHGAIIMLLHIGQNDVAQKIHNAWLRTIEDGIHTGDIYKEGLSKERVNTEGFTNALIERLGQEPQSLNKVIYSSSEENSRIVIKDIPLPAVVDKKLIGVDIFLNYRGSTNARILAEELQKFETDELKLETIAMRGLKLWPNGFEEKGKGDHWQCRFKATNDIIKPTDILKQLEILNENGFQFIKCENLYHFDGQDKFTVAQGG